MTRQGFDVLKAKLEKIKTVDVPRVEKALGEAIELGDVSDSAEFRTAREEMWRLQQVVAELEYRISCVDIVEESEAPPDEAAVGRILRVRYEDRGEEMDMAFVGEGETREGLRCVTVVSPIGQALLGRKVGDVVEVQAPRGVLRLRIVAVRPG